MRSLTSSLKPLMVGLLLVISGSAFANEDVEYTCGESAEKVRSIIDDWYLFVRDAGADAKNPSVIAMHADHEQGVLVEKFKRQCVESWTAQEEIYVCFSGIRSELGAAMCLHPDTNKNDWRYQ
jgi:hypothetical protein